MTIREPICGTAVCLGPLRVANAPVAMECRLHKVIDLGPTDPSIRQRIAAAIA